MSKAGKKLTESRKKIDRNKKYSAQEAVALAVDTAPAKFDESIDVAVRVGC